MNGHIERSGRDFMKALPMLMNAIYRRAGDAEIDEEWADDGQLLRGSASVADTVGLVGWVLQPVVSHECLLFNPRALVGQHRLRHILQRKKDRVAEVARSVRSISAPVWVDHARVEVRSPNLSGKVFAEWHRVGPSWRRAVVEYGLIFVSPPDAPDRRRLDVVVRWGGEQEGVRDKLPPARWRGGKTYRNLFPPGAQNVFDALEPYTLKRLYLPVYRGLPKVAEVRRSVDDIFALLLLYLQQGGNNRPPPLIDLRPDESATKFLLEYLKRFVPVRHRKEVKPTTVLGELLRLYRFPEDYRSFRKYVARTVRGLVAQSLASSPGEKDWLESQKDQTPRRQHGKYGKWVQGELEWEQDEPDSSLHASGADVASVAARLGVTRRSLYFDIASKKIHAEKDRRSRLTIPDREQDQLQERLKQKRRRQDIIDSRASQRKISKASARRWVERQEARGLSLNDIATKIRDEMRVSPDPKKSGRSKRGFDEE